MALLWCDGFDSYSATADLTRNWTGGASWPWNATSGVNGGGCLKSVTTATSIIPPINGFSITNNSPAGYCFWLKVTATPSANLLFLQEYTSAAAYSGGLVLLTTGVFRLTDNSGTLNRVTGVTNICDGNWHWIEWLRTQNTGTNALFVDGIVQWNGSFLLNNSSIAYFALTTAAQGNYTMDDFFFFDNTAGGPTTSAMPFGPKVITTTRPGSDSSIQFTPDTPGTNYTRVNETSADDDTSYVQDNVSGHADEYGIAALGFTPASILGVQSTIRVKNPGAGGISFKQRCHSGATTNDGTAVIASPNYANYRAFYGNDPNTSAAWTAANLASAKFGQVVV